MCGIAGICSTNPVDNDAALLKMRDSMVHRGPDASGLWWSADRRVGLAHRRLAIIDLSDKAGQPMRDASGFLTIVFNGEIYNFKDVRAELEEKGRVFSTNSDTEVIIQSYAQWGTDCLARFTGSFAFAIHDGKKNELFVARDRAGEKPLYYTQSNDRFAFASELKALMADPFLTRELDAEAMDSFLAYGCVGGERSILRGVRKLLPGHAMTLHLGSMSIRAWKYWELPRSSGANNATPEEILDRIESLLLKSVKGQLVADVPVGVLLSGGLDSSVITAIAARASETRIRTFTVSFPGHGVFDEGPFAKRVADHFGTEHTELEAGDASFSMLPVLARQFDEPIADDSIVPTSMLARLVRGSVTVALGGDGGDELFGGYQHYNYLQRAERIRRLVPSLARRAAAGAAAMLMPVGSRGRNHFAALGGGAREGLAAVNLFFDSAFRRRLLSPMYMSGRGPTGLPEESKSASIEAGMSVYEAAARSDFLTTMTDDYLVKSDRSSMMHSLELRAPFLDRDLIEFAFRDLPEEMRATKTGRKIALKMLARKLLPADYDFERKRGFSMPLNEWFRGEFGKFAKSVLADAAPGIFDRKAVSDLISLQERGYNNGNRIFALVMFELWRREYRVC